jgi:hypothetical protein
MPEASGEVIIARGASDGRVMTPMVQKTMMAEVAGLGKLKQVLEDQAG